MIATHPHGPDDRPGKKSPMPLMMEGLIAGGITCLVLSALVATLHYYGTAGHAVP